MKLCAKLKLSWIWKEFVKANDAITILNDRLNEVLNEINNEVILDFAELIFEWHAVKWAINCPQFMFSCMTGFYWCDIQTDKLNEVTSEVQQKNSQ